VTSVSLSDWVEVRLRDVTDKALNPDQQVALETAEHVNFLPMEAIGEKGELDLSLVRERDSVSTGYTLFFEGDVIVAKITPCFENGKGAMIHGLVNGIGFGTTELHVLRPNSNIEARFLYYITVSYPFRKLGEANMTGAAGQKRVPDEFVRNFSILLPPLSEQRTIADYLDHATAKIDTLIAAKQRLLDLLAEKRRALITHAVTRGLDATVPLRDSGVEWLGEIPRHWEVVSLKMLADVRTGVAKGRTLDSNFTVSVPYLRVANVQDGYLDLSDVAEIEVLPHEIPSFSLQKGDVLMNEGGDADKLGRGTVWDGSIEPCLHQNHVFAVRCFRVDPRWLSTVTDSNYAKAFFESRAKQSTNLASISATNLKELPVPVPPQEEQWFMMHHLEKSSKTLDRLIQISQGTIKLLHERRAALISAAVTGKLQIEPICN